MTWLFAIRTFSVVEVALEPVTNSVSTAVAACCKLSCSAPAQKFVNKFVSQVVSYLQAVFMCFSLLKEIVISIDKTFPVDSDSLKQIGWSIITIWEISRLRQTLHS